MKFLFLHSLLPLLATAIQDPLAYRSLEPVYTLPEPGNDTSLLDPISSQSDLSQLSKSVQQSAGFKEAFDTNSTWKFSLFAPNNQAFENTTSLETLSRLTFTLAILASTYLIRHTNQDPNPPSPDPPKTNEANQKTRNNDQNKKSDFLMTTGFWFTMARHVNLLTIIGLYHALISILPESQRRAICPNYNTTSVRSDFFTWNTYTVSILVILLNASLLRIAAYTNLGSSFTFHITKPAGLKTTGVYSYIRHPSYTGLFVIGLAMVGLFFRANGLIGCWVSGGVLAKAIEVGFWGWGVLLNPAVFWVRVKEEEEFLGGVFGDEWVRYCARVRRFVPGVL
ncbi:hypothetical protein BDW59DRAFT_157913 [Aspergillus cavernicola]|uniref:Protein-S-isoprenylcysteine O-methyltransferase n=1 Tax=Aspergillus cavernicola TaxID=176166 RepID=A0ABR4IUP1_9EURO